MGASAAGKGDDPRPRFVSDAEWARRHALTFGVRCKRCGRDVRDYLDASGKAWCPWCDQSSQQSAG